MNYTKKYTYVKNIDRQVKNLILPVIENTSFRINDDKILLMYDNAVFSKIKKNYFTKLNSEIIVEFSIYKNKISENNFISKGYYSTHVNRKTLDSNLYIVNSNKYNNIISLLDVIYYEYFVYSLDKYVNTNDFGGSTNYDYSNVIYDDKGQLIESNTVYCKREFVSNLNKVTFYSEFDMVADGDMIEIPITVKRH